MARSLPLVRLPSQAFVHRFGTPPTAPRSSALLRFPDKGWTINRGADAGDSKRAEGWAIVGDSEGRRLAVETLLSKHRIQPAIPPPGHFPYISTFLAPSSSLPENTIRPIRHLAFARPPTTGEFTDFTARYGALLEEDRMSFRETLQALQPPPPASEIDRVARLMGIDHLLDLPSVSLSSGQTRRARIASSLLTRSELLILEDPMAGLDIPSRAQVSHLLGELNKKGIRIVLVLRGKGGGEMPEWVTDVAEVRGGEVWIGGREDYEMRHREDEREREGKVEDTGEVAREVVGGEPVVKLDGVSVSYGEGTRPVLKDIGWTIKPGEKWHLIGANGSGKTTLLSIILGHHPRSYSLPPSSLTLFSKPRRSIPTPILRTLIGHTSPEIYASFPRGMGLTAMDAVGSGFEGIFSRRDLSAGQKERVLDLLGRFEDLLKPISRPGAPAVSSSDTSPAIDIARRQFSHFTPPQQGLLLFLRAIVNRPKLLILDEPSQGVDEVIWERCKALLEEEWAGEGKGMAVVVVSHYEDEVPWKKGRGKVLKLDKGVATAE